ncbi:multiheme c-type cytochrome [Thermodesulfobacteriota bacterium]
MMRYFIIPIVVLVGILSTGLSLASYRETFEREFMLSPWSIAKGETSACIQCHTSDKMGPEMHKITRQWKESWHARNNISCHDCHGGAPEDASMSMMHQRGFIGSPKNIDIPQFCGTCHIAILDNYLKSGHGKTFCDAAEGPSCVTCHGSHDIQQASMDIINEQHCSQCHTYERAKEMKQALFIVEDKLSNVEANLQRLKILGINVDDSEKSFFRTHSEFRALFHSIDVDAVRTKSSDYNQKLEIIESEITQSFKQLTFRRNFSAYLFLIFIGLSIVVFLLSKLYERK